MQLVGIQIYNLDIARIKNQRNEIHYNRTRITGTVREDQCTSLVTSHSFLPRMRNVSDKTCRENQNTHFMFNKLFFFFRKSCRL